MRKSWLEGLRAALPAAADLGAVEDGPWSAPAAVERGLAHEVGYLSDARKQLLSDAGVEEVTPRFGPAADEAGDAGFAQLLRMLSGTTGTFGGQPRIAVLPLSGAISMEPGGMFEAGGIVASSTIKVIRRLAEDDTVKAVVLRIDSPGGSALASDLMWHELRQLRARKPIVASVADMAASGGYYLACAANEVFAEKTSIVGSIGVVGGKIALGEAFSQVGVHTVTFPANPEPTAAARAAYMSSMTSWDDPTRERVLAEMVAIYDLFVRRVAEGRGLEEAAVREIAEGRIWTGAQGHENHLVDQLGGVAEAIQRARDLGGLDERAPVAVEGTGESLLQALGLEPSATTEELRAAWDRLQMRRASWLELVPAELRVFVHSWFPLANGERAVSALPFAIRVR
jgi:protease-4